MRLAGRENCVMYLAALGGSDLTVVVEVKHFFSNLVRTDARIISEQ